MTSCDVEAADKLSRQHINRYYVELFILIVLHEAVTAMEIRQGKTMEFICFAKSGFSVISMALIGVGAAQAASPAVDVAARIPENAKAKVYGSGWECDRGYRVDKGRCTPIRVPVNAYSTKSSFGPIWKCKRGYVRQRDTCVAIEVPAHGYLSSDGDGWRCNRGFVKGKTACTPIQVPANAFLSTDTYGRGWECERGYLAHDNRCVAIDVPMNAHLNFFGSGWECDRSYRRVRDECVEE
jgi:hypothetical protein